MTLSRQIMVGLGAGVAVGLFAGEEAGRLQLVADAYLRLLQMTVLPYVVVSLVAGLGSLSLAQARDMSRRVGVILVILWGLSIAFAFLIPLSFPRWESASFFSSAEDVRAEDFDFLGLYIPTNPFASLANNVVPAAVLFSVAVGVALIRVGNKEQLLGPLHVLGKAIGEVNQFVMRLAPIGLFATAASLSGTLRFQDLQRIEVYLVAYCAMALLLMLWALPALVGVLTPVGYRELVAPARDALLTAAVTGSLFAVLPNLGEVARDILRRHAPDRPEVAETPDVVVPASFSFPHAAKLLSLSFIPFAAWFAESPLQVPADYARLAGAGLLSFFGSLNAAVPFLLDLFHLPADAFFLFQATSVINSRVGSAVAAMHTLTVAVLGGFAMAGLMRVDRARLLRYLAVTAGLLVVTVGGLRVVFERAMAQEYGKDKVLAGMERIRSGVTATVHREPPSAVPEPAVGSLLDRIRARRRLRVGYRVDNPPYSFFNAKGELVGFDVEMAHQLARELGTGLEFVPVPFNGLERSVQGGCCDVVMTGTVITADRAARLTFTSPYLEEHLGFLVSDHDRSRFATRDALRAAGRVRVGVPAQWSQLERVREYAPEADIRPLEKVESIQRFIAGDRGEAEAVLLPAERGATWSLRHPELAAVVPDPPIMTLPLAYIVGEGDERLRGFLNAWIDLKKRDGTIEGLEAYWIYGHQAEPRGPRWSVMRDVLGWVK